MKQSRKMMVGLALFGLSAWAGAEVSQVRSMAATCANCHGTEGIAQPGMDSLAGQPRDVLLQKMLDYKSGKRPATVMHQLAKGYSDEQLEQLAGYFAALKK
jgi:sulfide dehydrogenase cytochrome subunit